MNEDDDEEDLEVVSQEEDDNMDLWDGNDVEHDEMLRTKIRGT